MDRETLDFDGVLEKVREAFHKRKGYASFWDFPNKQVKVRGVVMDLVEAMEAKEGACRIRYLVSNSDRNRAVDVFGTDILGRIIAYEVTELVSQEHIVENRRGRKCHKKWDDIGLITKLEERLDAKEHQLATVAYEKQVVVIFTDEPSLSHHWCVPILSGHSFGPFANICEAYLLFSPEPGREGNSYLKLTLK